MQETGALTEHEVFVLREFLDAGLCARLREEMSSGPLTPATMRYEGEDYKVDESRRRARRATVSRVTEGLLEERLLALRERLAEQFGTELSGVQELQFVIYREGDYIKRHADRARNPDDQHPSAARRVSVVVFLNGESAEPSPDGYGGGVLSFMDLGDSDEGDGEPVPLSGEQGMLVAFRPEIPHEVTPVTHGERFTIVSWFV